MLGPQPVTIHVTQEDIHLGVCKDAEECAIALALAHKYKDHVNWVEVENIDSIKMADSLRDKWYRVHICPDDDVKVHDFLRDFDDGQKVEPFSFDINEIEEE